MLDLTADPVTLTAALVDIPSESLSEQQIADDVEAALRALPHLDVVRDGHSIVARTDLGRSERVILAGHLDTVPENGNMPSRLDNGVLWGLGSCDMKSGDAIALHLAATVLEPNRDVTYVFYEAEEIAAVHNGLGRLARERPELLQGDLAILLEPSGANVEAGCQGTMRIEVRATGVRAHSARAWSGVNAIHALAPVLNTLEAYQPRYVDIDGLEFREGLNAVGIRGGVAGNVIPDEGVLTINFRFAPDRTEDDALAHLTELFAGHDITVTDSAPGALPGLSEPATGDFINSLGLQVGPKYGWTDVSKFSQLGIAALNYGPGDPEYAHKADEHVDTAEILDVEQKLRAWLTA